MAEANAERDALGVGLGLVLSAAHVHHGLRGADADGDEAFVRELCARLEIPLTVFRVDTAERMRVHGGGVEESARHLRYEALRGLLESGAADVVATAHTLDDQAETVMMKLLRGAWTEGLGGISPVVVEEQGSGIRRIVRPMLAVRRAEVEAFLSARKQSWRDDATNRDVTLTRNRVRHELMPALRGFNPGIDELLARMAAIARDEEAFWKTEVARLLPQLLLPGRPVRGGGRAVSTAVGQRSCALELARLRALAPALRRRVVRAAVTSLDTPLDRETKGCRLTAEETEKVLALGGFGGDAAAPVHAGTGARLPGKTGSRLELRGGLRVERTARELQFWRQN